jgi:hypothetical protein
MGMIHVLLTGISTTIIILSLNRLTLWTQAYLSPYEFLRFLDFNAMLPIPLISVMLYFFLLREIIRNPSFYQTKQFTRYFLLFLIGVYFFAAGSGVHEVTNYLNIRFCDSGDVQTALCRIIGFNDDTFSHYLYYFGFIMLNTALMLIEYRNPREKSITYQNILHLSVNALVIAIGIFVNLAFEENGIDLVFFAGVMLFSLYLLFFRRQSYRTLPVTMYLAIAYTVGVFSTLLYKIFMQ